MKYFYVDKWLQMNTFCSYFSTYFLGIKQFLKIRPLSKCFSVIDFLWCILLISLSWLCTMMLCILYSFNYVFLTSLTDISSVHFLKRNYQKLPESHPSCCFFGASFANASNQFSGRIWQCRTLTVKQHRKWTDCKISNNFEICLRIPA